MSDERPPNGQPQGGDGAAIQPGITPGMFVEPGPLLSVVAVAEYGDDKYVLLRCETPVGTIALLFDPDHATRVGYRMTNAAGEARGGLTIVRE